MAISAQADSLPIVRFLPHSRAGFDADMSSLNASH
jgi:hypothetical protein